MVKVTLMQDKTKTPAKPEYPKFKLTVTLRGDDDCQWETFHPLVLIRTFDLEDLVDGRGDENLIEVLIEAGILPQEHEDDDLIPIDIMERVSAEHLAAYFERVGNRWYDSVEDYLRNDVLESLEDVRVTFCDVSRI